jgi:hypothetical protein
MNFRHRFLVGMGLATLLFSMECAASSSVVPPAAQTGTVQVIVSDDATQDWATVGVKVLSVSLVPAGGGTPIIVYTAPSTVPVINLVQLDQLGEIIGNAAIPAGTYTDAKLTLSANPGDVALVTSAEPDAGFDLPAGTTVPSSQIRIQGATGSLGKLTVPVTLHLVQSLVVTAGSTNALDVEFDLKHPAFIVEHWPASSSAPIWAVNFNGPVRHHVVHDLTRLILRHTLGQVSAVSSDDSTITVAKDFAKYPVPATGEVPVASGISLKISADATNGTIFRDLDAKTKTTIKSFSTVAASLLNGGTGKYVRVAARYQSNGALVAVRIWASSSFQKVWFSPEGHVVHVDTTNHILTISGENGKPVAITIEPAEPSEPPTEFYFRTPQKAQSDATAIGTGTSFFDGITPGNLPNLARGFKVHVTVNDPTAAVLTADSVDIEAARYEGVISGANTSGFKCTRTFVTAKDDYAGTLPYIAATTANGNTSSGAVIDGFDWWYFTFPTQADTGTAAIADFVSVTENVANFGGTIAPQKVWSLSYANWGDGSATNPIEWHAKSSIIQPSQLPKGVVSSPWATLTHGGSFAMEVTGGKNPVTVDLSTVSGSASLVYQVSNVNGIVTVTQRDLTTATGLSSVEEALVDGTQVKVFGVPTSSGAVAAYVLFYYTGTTPR